MLFGNSVEATVSRSSLWCLLVKNVSSQLQGSTTAGIGFDNMFMAGRLCGKYMWELGCNHQSLHNPWNVNH